MFCRFGFEVLPLAWPAPRRGDRGLPSRGALGMLRALAAHELSGAGAADGNTGVADGSIVIVVIFEAPRVVHAARGRRLGVEEPCRCAETVPKCCGGGELR